MLECIWNWENSRDGQIEDILDLDNYLLMLVHLLLSNYKELPCRLQSAAF